MLQLINRWQPLLRHLADEPTLHPERLYSVFLQLAGDLATFRDERRPGAERREEVLFAEPREELEALQLVFDRILHFSKAQLDACRVQGVVELADDVSGGHIDAGDRLGRYHQPAYRCRRARYCVESAIVEPTNDNPRMIVVSIGEAS